GDVVTKRYTSVRADRASLPWRQPRLAGLTAVRKQHEFRTAVVIASERSGRANRDAGGTARGRGVSGRGEYPRVLARISDVRQRSLPASRPQLVVGDSEAEREARDIAGEVLEAGQRLQLGC